MCIQKITYSITFLFLSLSGFYSQSFSVKVDENHTAVFSIYNEPFAAIDSVQLINEQNNGNKYFTDQTPYFLISLILLFILINNKIETFQDTSYLMLVIRKY